jgi:predicted Zn finger-like uncharacterized protein
MRLVCPSCQTVYNVPDELLGGDSRRVQCKRCGHLWTFTAAAANRADRSDFFRASDSRGDAPARPRARSRTAPLTPRDDEEARRSLRTALAAQPARPVTGSAAVAGWAASALLLGGLGYAAYVQRDAVMAAWPPSQRVYMALGLR